MIDFDPTDPYPLLSSEPLLNDEYAHSALVDAWHGLDTAQIETSLKDNEITGPGVQAWIGLPTASLLTPYTEIRRLWQHLNPPKNAVVVDLGAAYGRMGFVLHRHWPTLQFWGFELVEERVQAGNLALRRQGCSKARLEAADLSALEFMPPTAHYYFLYDFGSRDAIEKTLHDLREIARSQPLTVVCRGRASRDAVERRHPWLGSVHAPEHFSRLSIYRSA